MTRCSPELRRSLARRFLPFFALMVALATGCQPPTPPVAVSHAAEQATGGAAVEGKADQARPEGETAQSDVIVVGAGISGLATALDLGRGGANVTVIDMSSVFGGHAVMSQGSLSIAGSPVQEASGINDSPDLAYSDVMKFGDDPDPEWVRYYVDNSRREIYDWVTDLGVRFEAALASPGNSVPREHQPAGRGIGLVTPIYRACLDQKTIRFVWNSKVEQLLTENGRVTGVMARNLRTDEEQKFSARGVVLATGGFQSNLDMVREFWPAEFRFPERILVGSGRNSVGFGHKLAETAGGELVQMDHQWNYFTGIPDPRFPGSNRGLSAANMYGIVVNPEGKRFANLHGWAKAVMPPLLAQKQATLWFVFDEATKPYFVVSGSDWADFKKVETLIIKNPALVKSAETLEELAEKVGLPPQNLAATVARYNELVEKGGDEDFHRFGPEGSAFSNEASPALKTPPYYAMQAWPLTRKSMGGVAIDRQCRVVDKQKQSIPGLYAVGELTGLALINGKAALEGTFLGPCIVTGRVAARSILKDLQREAPESASETKSCTRCHEVAAEIADPRPGYWHFENVHRVVLERGTDCRQCHSELTPYRADQHRTRPQSLTASCFQCHTARE
jgi:flavocytochrome c